MKYALAKVVEVQPLPGFKVRLAFADGVRGVYDCKPILWGEVFEPMKDPAFFARVFLDYGAPSWPNGADLDPGVLRSNIESVARRSARREYKTALAHEDQARYGDAPTPASKPRRLQGRSRSS